MQEKAIVQEPASQELPEQEVSRRETLDSSAQEGFTNEIQELRKALSAANEMIKTISDDKVKHNTAKTMPALPQFKSKCSYAVLGLSTEDSLKKAKVSKAFRDLIKCGYGAGHESFELLTAAKDTLLDVIEKAE